MTPPLREGAADLSETIGQPGAAALPRPTGIGEILSTALQFYRRHWRTLLTIAAVVVVPLTLLQYLLGDLVRTQGESTRNGVVETATWSVGIAGLLAALAVILMYLVLTGAITRAVAAEVAGEEPGVEQSYRFGFHRLGSVLLVSVLVGLATSRRGDRGDGPVLGLVGGHGGHPALWRAGRGPALCRPAGPQGVPDHGGPQDRPAGVGRRIVLVEGRSNRQAARAAC
jgi:hypothetical protein